MCQNTDGGNARIHTVGKREVDNSVFAAVGNGGFCNVLCENAQARALSACKQHCNALHFACHKVLPPYENLKHRNTVYRVFFK